MAKASESAISVGLIYVPVSLYKTTREIGISFNQLCKDSKQRVRYQKICPNCNKEVSNEDIVKGYEFEKGISQCLLQKWKIHLMIRIGYTKLS